MSIYSIKNTIDKMRAAVFTPGDITRISGVGAPAVYVYINRMIKKGLLSRVEKGKLTKSDDPFEVASQIVYPSYVSFQSGLYLYGIIQQVIDRIDLATSVNHADITFNGARVHFIRLAPDMMFGFHKVRKGGSFVFLGEKEKIILDCLLLPRYCGLDHVVAALKEDIDVDKLLDYAAKINKEAVYRRLGYLLDLSGINHSISRHGRTVYALNPSSTEKGHYDKKWGLRINEDLAV